jgi:hypothetical protein
MLHSVRHEPRSYKRHRKPAGLKRWKYVTLIAGFRTAEGVVICADSQQTLGIPLPSDEYAEYRTYINKIEPQHTGFYDVVIGGAGGGNLVDGFAEILTDQIQTWPSGIDDATLKETIRGLVIDYHAHEVSVAPGDCKSIQFLLCIRDRTDPAGHIHLLEIRETAIRRVNTYSLLGWEEGIYTHDIERHYRDNQSNLYSILLGIHLFLLAKKTSVNIGGETKIVVVSSSGMVTLDPQSVAELDQRVSAFDMLLDELRLQLSDTTFPPDEFEDGLKEFSRTVLLMHLHNIMYVSQRKLALLKADPNAPDDPYLAIPPFETLFAKDRVSLLCANSEHVYNLASISRDLAVNTRDVIAATGDTYSEGLIELTQKDRIADLLKGIAVAGKRATEILETLNAQGVALIPYDKSAEITRLFATEVVSPFLQIDSELARLPDKATRKIRAALESVRASLLRAYARRAMPRGDED